MKINKKILFTLFLCIFNRLQTAQPKEDSYKKMLTVFPSALLVSAGLVFAIDNLDLLVRRRNATEREKRTYMLGIATGGLMVANGIGTFMAIKNASTTTSNDRSCYSC